MSIGTPPPIPRTAPGLGGTWIPIILFFFMNDLFQKKILIRGCPMSINDVTHLGGGGSVKR